MFPPAIGDDVALVVIWVEVIIALVVIWVEVIIALELDISLELIICIELELADD